MAKVNVRKNIKFGVEFGYILDCINNEDKPDMTDSQKVRYFWKCFDAEYDCIQVAKRNPSLQDRVAQYLRGLPTCCSIAYMDEDIARIGKTWDLCPNKTREAGFVNGWWDRMALRLIQLGKKFNVIITEE